MLATIKIGGVINILILQMSNMSLKTENINEYQDNKTQQLKARRFDYKIFLSALHLEQLGIYEQKLA